MRRRCSSGLCWTLARIASSPVSAEDCRLDSIASRQKESRRKRLTRDVYIRGGGSDNEPKLTPIDSRLAWQFGAKSGTECK